MSLTYGGCFLLLVSVAHGFLNPSGGTLLHVIRPLIFLNLVKELLSRQNFFLQWFSSHKHKNSDIENGSTERHISSLPLLPLRASVAPLYVSWQKKMLLYLTERRWLSSNRLSLHDLRKDVSSTALHCWDYSQVTESTFLIKSLLKCNLTHTFSFTKKYTTEHIIEAKEDIKTTLSHWCK